MLSVLANLRIEDKGVRIQGEWFGWIIGIGIHLDNYNFRKESQRMYPGENGEFQWGYHF
jgi:hypothetical protein